MITLEDNDEVLRNNPESVRTILEYLYNGEYYSMQNFTGVGKACKTPEEAIEVLDREVFVDELEGERQRKGYDAVIYKFYYEKEKQKNGGKR